MKSSINNADNEISLIDLFVVLWHRIVLIISMTMVMAIGVFIYVFAGKLLPPEKSFLPDVYTSTAFMRIQSNQKSNSNTLSALLQQSSLGALNTAGGNSNVQLAMYIAGSNSFLDAIADEFNIAEKYKIKKFPRTSSRRIIKKFLKATVDDKSGIFSIAVTHIDPEFTQKVVLFAVQYYEARFAELGLDSKLREKENLAKSLNQSFDEIHRLEREARELENKIAQAGLLRGIAPAIEQIKREITIQEKVYSQLKVQYEVIKVEMAGETPVFQILDMPEIPEKKSGPPRARICIIAFAASLFLSIFIAFLLDAIQKSRKDFLLLLQAETKQEYQDEK